MLHFSIEEIRLSSMPAKNINLMNGTTILYHHRGRAT
jgi:hypothetical protein